jgi:phosphatidylglycerophosphate synthase
LAAQLATLLATGPFYLPGEMTGFIKLVVYSAAACVPLLILLVLGTRLVRDYDNRPVHELHLANKLTILRFVMVVPIIVLIIDGKWWAALCMYSVCSLTDVIDGLVARRRGETTEFGTIMDPLADITSTAGVFGALLAIGLVPAWVFAVLLVRYGSLFVGSLILFLNYGPIRFRATPVGKVVGVVQAISAIVIMTCAAMKIPWEGAPADMLNGLLGVVFSSVVASQLVIARRIRSRYGAGVGGARSRSSARLGLRQAN